jgi:hypothetical protein
MFTKPTSGLAVVCLAHQLSSPCCVVIALKIFSGVALIATLSLISDMILFLLVSNTIYMTKVVSDSMTNTV